MRTKTRAVKATFSNSSPSSSSMPTNSKPDSPTLDGDGDGDGDDASHHRDKHPPNSAPAPVGCFETDWSEKPTCLNCNTSDGSLLVCVERSCPIAFHDKCLRCMATFDDFGNFYCPYCAYKRALAESLQTRKNALLAKRLLSDFIDNKMPSRHKRKADVNANLKEPVLNTTTTVGENANAGDRNPKETTSNKSMQIRNPIVPQEDTGKLTTHQGSVGPTTPTKLQAENVDPSKNTAGKEATGDKNERVTTSFFIQKNNRVTTSLQNPFMKLASPIPTGAVRKKLMWTSEEEDMLKEGVHKFSTTGKNIPWRKILDFGRHIFDGTRTPEVLKDKWKNNLAKTSSPMKKCHVDHF